MSEFGTNGAWGARLPVAILRPTPSVGRVLGAPRWLGSRSRRGVSVPAPRTSPCHTTPGISATHPVMQGGTPVYAGGSSHPPQGHRKTLRSYGAGVAALLSSPMFSRPSSPKMVATS
jgi:hypothetical protein